MIWRVPERKAATGDWKYLPQLTLPPCCPCSYTPWVLSCCTLFLKFQDTLAIWISFGELSDVLVHAVLSMLNTAFLLVIACMSEQHHSASETWSKRKKAQRERRQRQWQRIWRTFFEGLQNKDIILYTAGSPQTVTSWALVITLPILWSSLLQRLHITAKASMWCGCLQL